jgi:hypothetical protein
MHKLNKITSVIAEPCLTAANIYLLLSVHQNKKTKSDDTLSLQIIDPGHTVQG